MRDKRRDGAGLRQRRAREDAPLLPGRGERPLLDDNPDACLSDLLGEQVRLRGACERKAYRRPTQCLDLLLEYQQARDNVRALRMDNQGDLALRSSLFSSSLN